MRFTKKIIYLKIQGVYDKESNDIVAENCGEKESNDIVAENCGEKGSNDIVAENCGDKESNDIVAENCGESSFQKGLSWGDGQRIVQLGALGEALGKFCGEGGSSTLDLRNTDSEKKIWFFMCKVCGMWCVTQYKKTPDHKGSRSYYTSRIISF